jgi:hypothetical protein
VFPQRLKFKLPYVLTILLLDSDLEKLKTKLYTQTHVQMFIAALFIITQKWTQCPLKNDQKNKMEYNHIMEYYSDIKRSQVLVAYACNPSYSGGRDQEDCGSKPDPSK